MHTFDIQYYTYTEINDLAYKKSDEITLDDVDLSVTTYFDISILIS